MRIVAPVSTVVLVPKSDLFRLNGVHAPNIPSGKNWTDCPEPGTIVLVQQPYTHISAIFGDIMVTRLKSRGVLGVVADGRIRDIASCMDLCQNGDFQVWHRGISAAGPSLEAKPWAVHIPLQIGGVLVYPGDILCADEGSQAIVVIPLQKLQAVMDLLPVHKKASDQVMEDVSRGYSLPEAVARSPDFYSNYR